MIKGLYIHIPFCNQICSYCDFVKQVAKPQTIEKYMDTLIEELKYYKDNYSFLETIYIGGGTPSSIPNDLLEKLLLAISQLIDLSKITEFSMESNPNDITEEFVQLIKKYSVNRLSIGVQTINNKLLKLLNRNHSKNDIIEALTILKRNHMDNFNLDFIYGIPYQTMENVQDDLEFIKDSQALHISYYSLIYEEKTVLDYQIGKGLLKPLDEDLVADFSDVVKAQLQIMGYKHYETSNYAFEGYQSRHNLIYWNLEEYLGIGLGAASQYDNKRLINQSSITKYSLDYKKRIMEDYNPKMEYLLMGLRKTEGISLTKYKERFQAEVFDNFPKLRRHLQTKLLVIEADYLLLTDLGQDLANQVYLDII
ncbi:MAG: radical SAM family heme chaperone HemW [Tenericutes bacterium]|nr:radical SAM family heme chaperone HemW [Mycoplasmatota bacterium]